MKNENRAPDAQGRFALNHIAAALALGAAAASMPAWGLGLGRLQVQSALGETLKAEIDLTSLSAEEAGTLKVRVAPPELYRSNGVDYNAVLTGTQVQVQSVGGRNVLRISSDRAVQEPFIDVILELSWSSGRLVREYTLLFDPPSSPKPQVAPPVVATAPAISPATPAPVPAPPPVATTALAPAPAARPPAPAASRPRAEPKPEVRAEAQAQAPAPMPRPPAVVGGPTPKPAVSTAASEYTVKAGDTLSRIAGKTQAPGISLDQMLVGLYRANPDAFVGDNMNRLKAGAVLQVPASDTLGSVPTAEARQVIQAQSADFSAYRQRLAGAAPTLKAESNERQAKGKVQAAVEDNKPAASTTPDKLTLSKAASAAAETKASKDTEKKDAATRIAELARNVDELKKLSNATKPPASAAQPAPAPAPAPAAAPAPAPTPAPTIVAAAPSPASAPAVEASGPAVVAPQPAASRPTPPPAAPERPEPGLMDQLMDSPLMLALVGLLAAGLVGLGLMRLRKRPSAGKADTGFNESRLQPDSFFGASGGARVDTRDGASNGASSMSYSLSQLDAIGDVDPVAEADVYLAYGRDLQAEEILKEALRANPERLAIRLKLLEVYAKRRDSKGFEQLAIQLYAETHGSGDDWARAQELGRQIDADNPLYQPGGAPKVPESGPVVHPEPMDASTLPQTVSTPTGHLAHMATEPLSLPRHGLDAGPSSGFGTDLDLDLDLDAPTTPGAFPATAMDATQALPASAEHAPMAMDFDLSEPPSLPAVHDTTSGADLQFDLDDFGSGSPAHGGDVPRTSPSQHTPSDDNALDFDLGSINLDLPGAEPRTAALPQEKTEILPVPDTFDDPMTALTERPPESLDFGEIDDLGGLEGADLAEDPLQRQLELADEFRQIGDTEGAREVLQELIGKADGELKAKAQAMLNGLR